MGRVDGQVLALGNGVLMKEHAVDTTPLQVAAEERRAAGAPIAEQFDFSGDEVTRGVDRQPYEPDEKLR